MTQPIPHSPPPATSAPSLWIAPDYAETGSIDSYTEREVPESWSAYLQLPDTDIPQYLGSFPTKEEAMECAEKANTPGPSSLTKGNP